MGYRGQPDCLASLLFCVKSMAAGVPLPDRHQALDFRRGRIADIYDRHFDRELPIIESRPLQSRRLPPL